MYYDGVWGTVCDHGWGGYDARVACRQLGYPQARYALGKYKLSRISPWGFHLRKLLFFSSLNNKKNKKKKKKNLNKLIGLGFYTLSKRHCDYCKLCIVAKNMQTRRRYLVLSTMHCFQWDILYRWLYCVLDCWLSVMKYCHEFCL